VFSQRFAHARGTNRKIALAVGASTMQASLRTPSAKRAFEGADEGIEAVTGQVGIATLAVGA